MILEDITGKLSINSHGISRKNVELKMFKGTNWQSTGSETSNVVR